MKRKCYALLALLLAVCMVLPMGVFVGAADTKEPVWTVKVSGSINKDGSSKETSPVADGGTVYVAVGGTATISVSLTEGYIVSDVRTNDQGKISLNKSDKSNVIVSGVAKGNDSVFFTATDKDGKNPKSFTVNVEVLTVQMVKATVNIDGTLYEDGDTISFKPGTVVNKSDFTANIEYSDGNKVSNKADAVSVTVNGRGFDENGDITIVGSDSNSFMVCTINDPVADNTLSVSLKVLVTGKAISNVNLSAKSDDSITKYDGSWSKPITSSDVAQNINIMVKYDDNSTAEIFDSYSFIFTNKVTGKGSSDISINIQERDNYEVEVIYDGVRSNTVALSDIIKVNEKVAKSFTMDVKNATKKDYIEGETLNDFSGITVTVTYTDKTEKTFKGDEIKSLNLYIHPFVYGEKNIIVEYGDLLTRVDVSYLNIARKGVTKIKAIDTNVKKKYAVGDKLDLTGLQVELTYNDGKTNRISYSDPKIECSPAHGSTITASMKKVMILYTGEDGSQLATSFDLTVTTDKKLNSADLAWGSNGKTEYFVGETFKPAGFRVTLFFNDGTKETLALDSSKLTVTYSVENGDFKSASSVPSFTKAQNAYVIAKIKYGSYADAVELQIPVTVTKRPNLKAITAICTKTNDDGQRDGYFVGDMPSVRDFEITVYYDDNSTRTFVVGKDETVSTRTPYSFTRKEDGVTYTVKLSPYTIAEDTKKITVSYNEYVTIGTKTNKTVETEVEVKVTIPDCILKHYTSSRNYETKAYESLYDALVDASDTYYDEIQLCRDVTMSTDYASRKTLEIDLNGHTLTMVRGELYVASNASSSTKITFTNSSRDDAHIRYTNNEDDDVIVAYNKEYVIDRSSKGDGRYDVTITSVKNGKVTGPTEVIHGHDAKFTITPDEGYEIAAIKVNSKTYKAASDNTLLIEDVREKLTVTVTFQEKAWQNPFTDVSKYATYYKAVQFVYEEGLFNGTSATKFEPDTTMTRAMFVTVLGRLAGVNVDNYKTSSFSDVATGQWYSEYVEWASSIGLVEGYGNGKFGPNDSITHAQMYVLMERYADIIEGKTTTASGTSISANDVRDIPDWAYEAVEYAAKKDFLVVSSYKLTPNDNAKRSELAMLLQKFCKNVLEY